MAHVTNRAMRRTGLLASLSLLLCLSFAAPLAIGRAQTAAPARAGSILLIGSSSVNGPLGRMLENKLEDEGYTVDRHGKSATGFARPDFFDWNRELGKLGNLRTRHAVLMYFGGNDTQGLWLRPEERATPRNQWVQWKDEAKWKELYTSRMRTFVNEICRAGARRVVVIPPSDGERAGWATKIRRIQAVQLASAEGTECGKSVPSHGPLRTGRDGAATRDGVHLDWDASLGFWNLISPHLLSAIEQ